MENVARIVGWQLVTALVVSLVSMQLGGEAAGISALLGGMSCVVPNMLFALGFRISERRTGHVSMGFFFVLEFVKVVLTIVLMVVSIWIYPEVSWVYFLVSLVIVLKSYFILLLKN